MDLNGWIVDLNVVLPTVCIYSGPLPICNICIHKAFNFTYFSLLIVNFLNDVYQMMSIVTHSLIPCRVVALCEILCRLCGLYTMLAFIYSCLFNTSLSIQWVPFNWNVLQVVQDSVYNISSVTAYQYL